MCPAVFCGANFVYKSLENSGRPEILEKLPTLQDGARPWISKLEELLVDKEPPVGDIKRMLTSVIEVPAMKRLLQTAGMIHFIATAVNDAELFYAYRGHFVEALKDVFPTNKHPDDIFIKPLEDQENPRAHAFRAIQTWPLLPVIILT